MDQSAQMKRVQQTMGKLTSIAEEQVDIKKHMVELQKQQNRWLDQSLDNQKTMISQFLEIQNIQKEVLELQKQLVLQAAQTSPVGKLDELLYPVTQILQQITNMELRQNDCGWKRFLAMA